MIYAEKLFNNTECYYVMSRFDHLGSFEGFMMVELPSRQPISIPFGTAVVSRNSLRKEKTMLRIVKNNFTFLRNNAELTLADGRVVTPLVTIVYTNPDWQQSEDRPEWRLSLMVEYSEGAEPEEENYVRFSEQFEARIEYKTEFNTHWCRDAWLTLRAVSEAQLKLQISTGFNNEKVWVEAHAGPILIKREYPCTGGDPVESELPIPVCYFGNHVEAADRQTYERAAA